MRRVKRNSSGQFEDGVLHERRLYQLRWDVRLVPGGLNVSERGTNKGFHVTTLKSCTPKYNALLSQQLATSGVTLLRCPNRLQAIDEVVNMSGPPHVPHRERGLRTFARRQVCRTSPPRTRTPHFRATCCVGEAQGSCLKLSPLR